MANVYSSIAQAIIEQQEGIIGPVAIEQAKAVSGLEVDWTNKSVVISGDSQTVIDELVAQYQKLFGQISVEVSKEAANRFTSQLKSNEVPQSLK